MTDLECITGAWRGLTRAGAVDFSLMDVYLAPPPLDLSGMIASDPEPNNETLDHVSFYLRTNYFNGNPVRMVHGEYRGTVVNLAMDPPQVLKSQKEAERD